MAWSDVGARVGVKGCASVPCAHVTLGGRGRPFSESQTLEIGIGSGWRLCLNLDLSCRTRAVHVDYYWDWDDSGQNLASFWRLHSQLHCASLALQGYAAGPKTL